MNTGQRILKNFLSLSFAEIVLKFLGVITTAYLARVLAPENFGKIYFALAFVSYFTLMSDLGLNILGTREIAKARGEIHSYVGNIVAFKLCLSIPAFGLLFLFAVLLNKPSQIKYLIVFYGLGILPSAFAIEWVFQGVEKMEYIGISRILAKVPYVALIFLFIKSPKELLQVPWIMLFSILISSGFLILAFIKFFGGIRLKFNPFFWKLLIKQALPIGIMTFLMKLIYYLDTVMLGFMRSNEEVGYYNAAYAIIWLLISFFAATYHDTIFPVIARHYKTSLVSVKDFLSRAAKPQIAMVLPLAFGGTVLARPIMNLIYGSKYEGGVIAFQILIWTVAIISINGIYARSLLACDRQNRYLVVVIIQTAVNLILNFILIPLFGLVGAAIATVSAEIAGFPFYYWEFKKVITGRVNLYIPKPLVTSIIMALLLQLGLDKLNLSIFLLIPGGVLIYFVSLYLIKGITSEDIKLIRNLLGKIEGRKA